MTTTAIPSDTTTAEVIALLTLEQKASLLSGADLWTTKAVPGVPAIVMTDGPHGVRKEQGGSDHLGLGNSVPATCFPPAVALASNWDVELVEKVGVALGEESVAEQVGVLLGPGINIKRSPLGGRNFEYFSEDPILSGILGSALVRGIQSQGVGASLKHFAANNQETDRMRISSDVDERPLREIYLRGFQRVVTTTQPWTVMCSYNRINGIHASEDPWLLTSVLRDEWGFEGLVVSDWGAVVDRVKGIAAGLDLEMPSSNGLRDAQVVAAVKAGALDEKVVNRAAGRLIDLVRKTQTAASDTASYDVDAHHALAREVAGRSIVLLKNDDHLLPLATAGSIAVIGEFARTPRYQGGGSSHVNPTRLDMPLDEIRALAGDAAVSFAPGFVLDETTNSTGLLDGAIAAASAAQTVVLFLGLTAPQESEGFDRENLDLPANQLAVLDAVLAANRNVVVVLSHGGVVDLTPLVRVPAIVEGWLLGQAGGGAIADVLFGAVNPSGHLAETIPLRIEDTPAFLNFPGENGRVRYGEGLFVGYRYYDARKMSVAYPFGHGLSYTTFDYSALHVTLDADGFHLRVTVTNSGDRAGREVVQVYCSLPESRVVRAPRELKAFANIHLEAGESREVALDVRREDLAYYETRISGWVVEGGEYAVEVGASSRDIRVDASITVDGDAVVIPLSMNSTLGELLADPVAAPMVMQGLAQLVGGGDDVGLNADPEMLMMMSSFPIGRFASFAGPDFDPAQIEQLIAAVNAAR
ncbi:MAG TPA: glycoside hydrolase family 3 C-terminal domain-containing protein [Galbitalea sp.]|jgi:beta-glucosidase|nr:glycoside hydrolase family 3 C-terminal domain-containing protein [Galbitalea sp.]